MWGVYRSLQRPHWFVVALPAIAVPVGQALNIVRCRRALRLWLKRDLTTESLPNRPLQQSNATHLRSRLGVCRDAAGCARGSSRP